ncbi:TPA: hypothetical protein PW931_004875 [Escherichia coli]|uniref:hypothetical protein n=4 Tax=Enterobacteriaceae TaxID=543 RepID=UPI001955246C|nr:hypothetical protein [Klebsiella pneumoniae]EES5636013.1 hypothetical protein [Escherichia coli]HBX5704510.1 hypothetical protein [Klebsiella pneumoniae]HBY4734195.1 hypothetical protein [Klebsiella pneumoniae]HCB8947485.1 hypothetical protein [Klebsiella pneumoniae]HDL4067129.1 hypothetical protein [Escherichia coli]
MFNPPGVGTQPDEDDILNAEKAYIYNKALEVINEENIFEIMSLIPKPFLTNNTEKEADILSVIYNKFLENTEIPCALPVFSFFSFLSAYCVKNNITYSIPLSDDKKPLDTWITVLAPSGSAKTFSNAQINKMIPKDLEGKKIIEPNFTRPNGAAKFIQDLAELPETKDGQAQYGYWVEDEAAQMFKQIEKIGSPLSEIKEYLLKSYDHSVLTRKTKNDTVETKNIILTLFFINTFESYVNNISNESMTDGLMRRFNLVYSEKDGRDFTDYSIYNENKIRDEVISEKMIDFFFSIKPDQHFTFSDECFELYRKYFKIYWHKKYKNILPGKENFYRTYMMQSWKFAIFYHFILGKTGNVIDGECLVFGMKISLLFAESMKKFFDYKVKPQHIEKAKSDLDKYINYLNTNTDIKMRDFTRKFNIKKAEALIVLNAVKESKIIKNHILFKEIKE